MQNFDKDGYRGVTETWNVVQHEVPAPGQTPFINSFSNSFPYSQMDCCGAQEYKDWTNTSFSKPNNAVPDSCCLSDVEGCGADILKMSEDQAGIIRT